MFFKKNNLYKVNYRSIGKYSTLIVAKSVAQAIKKVQKQFYSQIDILNIELIAEGV